MTAERQRRRRARNKNGKRVMIHFNTDGYWPFETDDEVYKLIDGQQELIATQTKRLKEIAAIAAQERKIAELWQEAAEFAYKRGLKDGYRDAAASSSSRLASIPPPPPMLPPPPPAGEGHDDVQREVRNILRAAARIGRRREDGSRE